jgi:hypothetical protein
VTFEHDSVEVDALRTDHYLDAILAAAERHAIDAPAAIEIDPGLRRAAVRLRRDLVRVHPSFRFEERLARRLAEAAASLAAGSMEQPDAPADVRPNRGSEAIVGGIRWDPGVDPAADLTRSGRRPLIIRGAVASAALSLAGAAIVVARRRARPLPPMARAARAVRHGSAARRFSRARRARLA